jgi:hypothetical protein
MAVVCTCVCHVCAYVCIHVCVRARAHARARTHTQQMYVCGALCIMSHAPNGVSHSILALLILLNNTRADFNLSVFLEHAAQD